MSTVKNPPDRPPFAIYWAGPFFHPKYKDIMIRVKEEVKKIPGVIILDPADLPVIEGGTVQQKSALSKIVFRGNVQMLKKSHMVVALTDDFDTGTVWEMGVGWRQGTPVVTWSTQEFGANIMLENSVVAHFSHPDLLLAHLPKLIEILKEREFK